QYTIALAEAAASQGAEYFFGREVMAIVPRVASQAERPDPSAPSGFLVTAQNLSTGEEELYQAELLINSAGLFADEICRMVGINDYKIYPCRGEYHILEKSKSKLLELPIYPIPNEKEGGLGVHLTPAIHGNILIGPSAEYLTSEQEREEYSTTWDVMAKLSEEGVGLFSELNIKDCIRSFAGIRPKLASEEQGGYADFVIKESKQVPGFIQLVGIESPGLTASIPIGKMVAQMAEEIMARNKNSGSMCAENGGSMQTEKSPNKTNDDPGDQKMLCRCEGITEEAVLEAFDRIIAIGAIPTIKALKNRTRVTMGNCQGSFCTINIIELLQKKRNVDPLTLLWNGFGSLMFDGRVKE
ncbi:MAG TPA: FAD-dependent oxidoreductase, partial [Anaerovoracaceae bacterium]|nr:FAD-dependent oxidoreductase [Anaerovoracaceae bacterium]